MAVPCRITLPQAEWSFAIVNVRLVSLIGRAANAYIRLL